MKIAIPFQAQTRAATRFLLLPVVAATLVACGGGGGEEPAPIPSPAPTPAPTTAYTLAGTINQAGVAVRERAQQPGRGAEVPARQRAHRPRPRLVRARGARHSQRHRLPKGLIVTLKEQERRAYIEGNVELAKLLAALIDALKNFPKQN